MKILFLTRPDLFTIKAGDTVQIEGLREALNRLDISVDISSDLKPSLDNYDLVHCFNMLRVDTCKAQCRWVKDRNKPLILTPIYWDLSEYLALNYPERLKWWEKQQKNRYELLKLIDLLAPNAKGEYRQIEKNFSLSLPYEIIHNGVERDFVLQKKNVKRDYILSVGRIHPRKNQLNMIKALKDTNIPLIIIGKINDKQYYRRCCEEAGKNVKFIGQIERSKLKSYYQQAKIHLMVSWYDTPGLVNLEAGLAGCKLVVTSRGTTYDYFAEKAEYCAPDDIEQIKKKVLKSYQNNLNNNLQSHIKNNFTWEKIALNTRNIYSKFLS